MVKQQCVWSETNLYFFVLDQTIKQQKSRKKSRVPNTSDTSATEARRVRHKWQESSTQVQHECYTSSTSTKRVKNFDFDNDTNKNKFSHSYIYYIARERLWNEEQVYSKNYLFEMPHFHAKMRLKSALQKQNFLMAKARSRSCTLDLSWKWPCTFPHSYAQ